MWFPKTLRTSRPCESARGRRALLAGCGLLFPLLLPVLLSGCGGGGSGGINSTSTSDQGFRIVPAGGDVIPLGNVDPVNSGGVRVFLKVPPNAVASGVVVTASALADVSATGKPLPTYLQSAPAGASTTSLVSAYQITFSSDSSPITVRLPAILTLSYAAVPLDGNKQPYNPASTFRIYFLDAGVWVPLPQNVVTPADSTVTATLGTLNATAPLIRPNLKSGVYAIFATGAPAPAPLARTH